MCPQLAQTTGPTFFLLEGSLERQPWRTPQQFGVRASLLDDTARHGVRSSLRRGAEIPTNTGLVGSYWQATDPRTGKIESCVLASVWPRASHSRSHVGGVSGHSLDSPVVLGFASVVRLAGRWCFWWLWSWRWCFSLACGLGVSFFRSPLRGCRPEDRFSSASIPCMFWDLGSLSHKHRVGGLRGCEQRDGSDGWGSPVPRSDNAGGRDHAPPPQPSPSGPANRFRTS